MEEAPPLKLKESTTHPFNSIGEDVLELILSKLPAPTFASAACVSRSWTLICNRILTTPKMLSALSLQQDLQEAIDEVLDKVLGEPIRPQFAIAFVGRMCSVNFSHTYLAKKLGSHIPILVSESKGIIGNDIATNQYREVRWDHDDSEDLFSTAMNECGIALTLGYLPALKVCTFPLLVTRKGSETQIVDKFLSDIKDYTESLSGHKTPVGIIMFGDPYADMGSMLEKMDCALSRDTIVIGDESGCFACNDGVDFICGGSQRYVWRKSSERRAFQTYFADAVALVFATDRGKPQGVGDIRFSLASSSGVSPVGPVYKGVSVKMTKHRESSCSTWLTARREDSIESLAGEIILQDLDSVIEDDDVPGGDVYIGVAKRRKCHLGPEKGKFISSLSFHEVSGGDESYLYVKGGGIKTGDKFQFFHPDPKIALKSHSNVFEKFRAMKQNDSGKTVVCGGILFSCYGRDESFLGHPNVDSSTFLENFPGVSLSGKFCIGEIGRSSSASVRGNSAGQRCNWLNHVYSAVYLLILHSPSSPH